MFLKTIEIRGFKSFADKTELKLKNGVTAVVGPNGSGKSNISDAVRWVLGEQSIKTLRGGKMEDVIFAGTQFRKAVGLAQVAITLDNSDYDLSIDYSDVTISRRLYRSGESEYYINNTQCRLKDIQELFMDTGIGKEGYSIIGQGKIEAILSGRPEERRNLLEEAAGIVKFKSRKEEAEKKLSNTEQNLLRIHDILSTYEERLEPLRIENEKAKKFIEISDILKEKEVSVILYFIEKNDEKISFYSNAIKSIENDIENILIQKEEVREKLNGLYGELDAHEKKSSLEKEQYYDVINAKQNIASENQVLHERISNLKEYIAKYEKEMESLTISFDEMAKQKSNMELELSKYQKEQVEINHSIKLLEDHIEKISKEILSSERELTSNRDDEVELISKITALKNEITSFNINYDNLYKRQQQLKSLYDNYIGSLKINTTTAEQLQVEQNKIANEIVADEEEIKKRKKEMLAINKEISEKESQYKNMTADHSKFEAHHNALVNLEKHYEGYNKTVKTLMTDIENNKIPDTSNNVFLLGNIIKVPDKLEVAIEVALGGAISNIITTDDSIAKLLIEYLKRNSLGRATFLPLNIIDGKKLRLDENIRAARGYIGIASELIEYDGMFQRAIEYVLGRTIICDNLDNAMVIAKRTSFSYRIVTLSGEIINTGGSLTGGSLQNKGNNVLGRRREIEELNNKIIFIKQEIESLSNNLAVLKKDQGTLDDSILSLREQIHFKQIETTKIQGKSSAIAEDSEKLKINIKTTLSEIQTVEDKINKYNIDIKNNENKIFEISKLEENNKVLITQLQQLIDKNRDELNEIKNNQVKNKISKAQIDEMVLNKIKDLERGSRELDGIENRIDSLQKEIKEARKNISEGLQKIEDNNKSIQKIEENIDELENKFKENEVIKIKFKDNIKNSNEQLQSLENSLTSKENERHKNDISFAKFDMEKQNLYSKLNDDYNLTLAEAQKYKVLIDNPEEIKKQVQSLKNSISDLGTVNLGAIEEYKQISEKYSFMSLQRDDLIKAKDELVAVINEMTDKMKSVFNENFNKLRIHFNETFRELFKGGSADLILGEGDELTAAIDINVQPPGKKLQNINLMSGGEKGLSAIALLFAILKMKPTPFCILDEIEAALDDANVARYAEFLKTFSKNIQFIVITHRKGTMEASDMLYGVTMEEKGVSKIVSVDLSR